MHINVSEHRGVTPCYLDQSGASRTKALGRLSMHTEKVISEGAKTGEWMHFSCIRRVSSVEAGTTLTESSFEELVSALHFSRWLAVANPKCKFKGWQQCLGLAYFSANNVVNRLATARRVGFIYKMAFCCQSSFPQMGWQWRCK